MHTAHDRTLFSAVLLGCSLAALPVSALAQNHDWAQVSPTAAPSARSAGFMVFDSLRERTVLFGGLGTSTLSDTWEHDGANWIQRSPSASPSARNNGGYTYDSRRGRMVIFGGFSSPTYYGDTWAFGGTNWTQLAGTGPSARAGAALAYDAARDRVVLFGGSPGGTSRHGDTWEFNGSTWVQFTPVPAPSARTTRMVYDAARGQTVLFGGSTGAGVLNDTWTWNGSQWSQVITGVSPTGRWRHGLEYDSTRQRVVLFGGVVGNTPVLNDTWVLSGSTWTQQFPATAPLPRYFPGMAYDDSRDTLLVFGGSSGGADTWEYAPPQRASYRQLGAGCAGSAGTPTIRRNGGLPLVGQTFAPQLANTPGPSGLAFFTFGFTNVTWSGLPLPFDLAPFGLPGCLLRHDVLNADVLLTSNGTGNWQLPIPNQPWLLGVPFFNQALVIDPLAGNAFGGAMSNAMRAVIGS